MSGGSLVASARQSRGEGGKGLGPSLQVPLPVGCEADTGERVRRNAEERTGHRVVGKSQLKLSSFFFFSKETKEMLFPEGLGLSLLVAFLVLVLFYSLYCTHME